MSRLRQRALCDAHVAAEMTAWRGQHNHGDGLTALEFARQHRAQMRPERRAELDGEWA